MTRNHEVNADAGSGLPVPHRRTFATALQAFAHSVPASLSASMPALANKAGSRSTGSPGPPFVVGVWFFMHLSYAETGLVIPQPENSRA